MKEKTSHTNAKKTLGTLHKKTNRIEKSREKIKAKSREKGVIIKRYQDRVVELTENRDDWKTKWKKSQEALSNIETAYTELASMLNMKEDELRKKLKEIEKLKESKKKPRKSPSKKV